MGKLNNVVLYALFLMLSALPGAGADPGSEGMAGSFAAVCDDVSFLEWNPAGSSVLPSAELAFFHHSWTAGTNIEGAAFASRHKDFGFAAGGKWLYAPMTERNAYGRRVSKGYYSEAVAALNGSYNFFSGRQFSGLSLGLTVKGAFRFVPGLSNSGRQQSPAGSQSGSGLRRYTAAALADMGALTRINFLKFYNSPERNLSFALVLRNLGVPVVEDLLPTTAVAGLSWKPLKPLLLSFDYSIPLATAGLSEPPYWAAGLSARINNFLSINAGLQARGGATLIALGGAVGLGEITLDLGYVMDILPRLDPSSRISLGVRFNLGDHEGADRTAEAEQLYVRGLRAYAQGETEAARQLWEEALVADPRFKPAAEGIAALDRAGELIDRIKELHF